MRHVTVVEECPQKVDVLMDSARVSVGRDRVDSQSELSQQSRMIVADVSFYGFSDRCRARPVGTDEDERLPASWTHGL